MVGSIATAPVNETDMTILPDAFDKLMLTAQHCDLDLSGSFLNLDSGFDSKDNKDKIKEHRLIPNIYPNKRNTKNPEKIKALFTGFRKDIYNERFKIERSWAWEDTYRKLVIRYEKLAIIHLGFQNLAFSLINLRNLFVN